MHCHAPAPEFLSRRHRDADGAPTAGGAPQAPDSADHDARIELRTFIRFLTASKRYLES